MVLRIFKMIATSVFVAVLESTKFIFGRGCATGVAHSAPQTHSWFKGPILRGWGKGEGR